MKEVITSYYCDRCGSEFKPYGTKEELTPGFGVVAYVRQYCEPTSNVFSGVSDFESKPGPHRCAMALCKKCMDELTEFLKGK